MGTTGCVKRILIYYSRSRLGMQWYPEGKTQNQPVCCAGSLYAMLMGQRGSWDSRQEGVCARTEHLQSNIETQDGSQAGDCICRSKRHF